jgi:hypothetical protein
MSKQKLTPEFPGNVRPFRSGVYQARMEDDKTSPWEYAYWNARERRWCPVRDTPEDALNARLLRARFQNKPWRGLAADPKVAQKEPA